MMTILGVYFSGVIATAITLTFLTKFTDDALEQWSQLPLLGKFIVIMILSFSYPIIVLLNIINMWKLNKEQ